MQIDASWPPAPPCQVPPAPTPTNVPKAPTFSGATNTNTTISVDTPAMTVLATLAHEYGHILWYDLIKGNNNSYMPMSFCRSSGIGFFDNAWSNVSMPATNFITFAAPPPTTDTHKGIQTTQLITAINKNKWTTAVNYLNEYLTPQSSSNPDGVWPSVFGSISPQEDFVETFKIYIMTNPTTNSNAPVTSMPLNLYAPAGGPPPPPPPDIYQEIAQDIAQGRQHERKRKMDCIAVKWAAFLR